MDSLPDHRLLPDIAAVSEHSFKDQGASVILESVFVAAKTAPLRRKLSDNFTTDTLKTFIHEASSLFNKIATKYLGKTFEYKDRDRFARMDPENKNDDRLDDIIWESVRDTIRSLRIRIDSQTGSGLIHVLEQDPQFDIFRNTVWTRTNEAAALGEQEKSLMRIVAELQELTRVARMAIREINERPTPPNSGAAETKLF